MKTQQVCEKDLKFDTVLVVTADAVMHDDRKAKR